MNKAVGILLLLAPLVAAQLWLWPLGIRAVRSERLSLPERYETSEPGSSRSRVHYRWIPLEEPDAVRFGWGMQAAAAMLGVWSAAVLLYGAPGWRRIRRPLAVVSALFAAAALVLLLPPWKARAFPLAGGCWVALMLVGAVEFVSGPLERRFGRLRMQALNRTAGGVVLVCSAVLFGWGMFFGGVIGAAVLALAWIHAGFLQVRPDAPSLPRPEARA